MSGNEEDKSHETYDPTRVDVESQDTSSPKTTIDQQVFTKQDAGEPMTSVHAESEPASSTPPVTTADYAQRSRKELRRERDARAEKAAMRVLLFLFVGLCAAGLFVVNSGLVDLGEEGTSQQPQKKRPTAPVLSAQPIEESVIPALKSMEQEGLTIVAEGLPEVVALRPANPPAMLVGIESCRYAFAIWEFSPNKRFRFMTTCELMRGEILAGAWSRDGNQILLSPLTSAGSVMTSRFEVEKPSRMVTDIVITAPKASSVRLKVRQRITGMRPGMDGAGFIRSYEPRNTVKVQGIRIVPDKPTQGEASGNNATPEKPGPAKAPSGDSLLDMLE